MLKTPGGIPPAAGQFLGFIKEHRDLRASIPSVSWLLSSSEGLEDDIDVQIKNENLRAISTLSRLPNPLKHYLTSYSSHDREA